MTTSPKSSSSAEVSHGRAAPHPVQRGAPLAAVGTRLRRPQHGQVSRSDTADRSGC
jgi:hypothetical protein